MKTLTHLGDFLDGTGHIGLLPFGATSSYTVANPGRWRAIFEERMHRDGVSLDEAARLEMAMLKRAFLWHCIGQFSMAAIVLSGMGATLYLILVTHAADCFSVAPQLAGTALFVAAQVRYGRVRRTTR